MRFIYIAVFLFLNFATTAHAQFFPEPQFKILHHYLRLKIYPEEGRLEAHDTLTIKSLADNVTKIEPLTLQEMKIKEVKVNGEKVKRKYLSPILTIPLQKALAKDEEIVVDVLYKSDNYYQEVEVESDILGEIGSIAQINPHSSYSTHGFYYPDNDFQSTADIEITVPKGYTAISAGALLETKEENGFSTFHWKCNSGGGMLPFAWAVAKYKKFEAVSKYGDKIEVYTLPEDEKYGAEKLKYAIEIVDFLTGIYGRNPFEKIGIVEIDPKVGVYGCSTKTLAFFSKKKYFAVPMTSDLLKTKRSNATATLVLVDEISHQWNAYKVETENFLAEAMADYTDTLFAEHLSGKEILKKEMIHYKTGYLNSVEKYGQDVPIYNPSNSGELGLYASVYFRKGAYALHMLRMLVGDKLFFKALKDYFTKYEGQRVKFDAFEKTFKETIPYDISWFFEQWFHQTGYPQYEVSFKSTKQKGGKYKVNVTITQKQKELFKMPLDITVKMNGKKSKTFERIWVEKTETTQSFVVDKKPVSVVIDEDEKVLKTVEYK